MLIESQNADGIERTAMLLGMDPDGLRGGLNLVEAAEALGLSPSGLRAMALRGEIGHQRYGRAWRFMWWHLLEFINAHEVRTRSCAKRRSGAQGLRSADDGSVQTVDEEARALGLV